MAILSNLISKQRKPSELKLYNIIKLHTIMYTNTGWMIMSFTGELIYFCSLKLLATILTEENRKRKITKTYYS